MNNLNEKDIIYTLRLLDLYKFDLKYYERIFNRSYIMWYRLCTTFIKFEVQKRRDKKIKDYLKIMKKSNKWFYLNSSFSY